MSGDREAFARLPEPPPVTPEAQDAAISRALEIYDRKYFVEPEGFLREARLTERTAMPPSHWRSAMPRMRYLVAASIACFFVAASSVTYFRAPPGGGFQTASVPSDMLRNAPDRVGQQQVQPKIVPPAPPPAPEVRARTERGDRTQAAPQ